MEGDLNLHATDFLDWRQASYSLQRPPLVLLFSFLLVGQRGVAVLSQTGDVTSSWGQQLFCTLIK